MADCRLGCRVGHPFPCRDWMSTRRLGRRGRATRRGLSGGENTGWLPLQREILRWCQEQAHTRGFSRVPGALPPVAFLMERGVVHCAPFCVEPQPRERTRLRARVAGGVRRRTLCKRLGVPAIRLQPAQAGRVAADGLGAVGALDEDRRLRGRRGVALERPTRNDRCCVRRPWDDGHGGEAARVPRGTHRRSAGAGASGRRGHSQGSQSGRRRRLRSSTLRGRVFDGRYHPRELLRSVRERRAAPRSGALFRFVRRGREHEVPLLREDVAGLPCPQPEGYTLLRALAAGSGEAWRRRRASAVAACRQSRRLRH
mmetsp:Transcript_93812/g.264998  ORF Transcript_93812/g.264998 Transcript_93812/m.264998 type:complete len:313 (-) Transcript_93812:358-1296(-)